MNARSRIRRGQRLILWLSMIVAFLVLPVLPAGAAPITYKILFAADTIIGPSPVPTTTAGGLFTLTFDPTHNYAVPADFAGSSIITNFLSVPSDTAVGFLYDLATDRLSIGGLASTVALLHTTENDFGFTIDDFTTAPLFSAFGMTNGTLGAAWHTDHGIAVVQVVPSVATTPIPATLPLLVTALAGLVGWQAVCRRRSMTADA